MQCVSKGCILDVCIRTKRVHSMKKQQERGTAREGGWERNRDRERKRELGEAATSQCTPIIGMGLITLTAIESVTASSRCERFAFAVVTERNEHIPLSGSQLERCACVCVTVFVFVNECFVCFWFCSCIFDICFFAFELILDQSSALCGDFQLWLVLVEQEFVSVVLSASHKSNVALEQPSAISKRTTSVSTKTKAKQKTQ